MLALISVVGARQKDYESAAISCGQAIFLTHMLREVCNEMSELQYFLPAEDLDQLGN